jgi:protein SCO1/2
MMRRRTVLLRLASIWIGAALLQRRGHTEEAAPAAGVEVSFDLVDTTGRTVDSTELRDRWLLVFFGYTSCPDLCPTALLDIAQALTQLGPLAVQVQPIFVSVDLERDTPERLREYVNSFDERILPLTGTADQLGRAAKAFGVAYFKIPGSTAENYTVAHSALITVVGPEGGLVTRFSTGASANQIASALRKLIHAKGP